MPRIVPLITLAAAVALAGCAKSEPADQATANTAATTDYLAKIEALPEGQREGVFLRAIRDAGQPCQGVTKAQSTKTGDGKPAWAATCTDGPNYVLVLGQDGTMTVIGSDQVQGSGG